VTAPSRCRIGRLLIATGVLLGATVVPAGARAQDTSAALPTLAGIRVTVLPAGLQLAARRDSFRILIQDSVVGGQVIEVRRLGDSVVLHERTVIPPLDMSQETRVVMDARSLAPWSVEQTGHVGSQLANTRIVMSDGRVRGRAETPGVGGESRVTEVDTLFPVGTIDVNQIPLLVPLLPLVEGIELGIDVFNAADGSIRPYRLRVEPDSTVDPSERDPDVVRVLVLGGEPTRWYVRRDWSRQVVRIEGVKQPLVFELVR